MTSELSKRWDKEERELEKGAVIVGARRNWFDNFKENVKKLFKK